MSYSKNVLLSTQQQGIKETKKPHQAERTPSKATLRFHLFIFQQRQSSAAAPRGLFPSCSFSLPSSDTASLWSSGEKRRNYFPASFLYWRTRRPWPAFSDSLLSLWFIPPPRREYEGKFSMWAANEVREFLKVCRLEIIMAKAKRARHEWKWERRDGDALEGNWNEDQRRADWTIIHKWMQWEIFQYLCSGRKRDL